MVTSFTPFFLERMLSKKEKKKIELIWLDHEAALMVRDRVKLCLKHLLMVSLQRYTLKRKTIIWIATTCGWKDVPLFILFFSCACEDEFHPDLRVFNCTIENSSSHGRFITRQDEFHVGKTQRDPALAAEPERCSVQFSFPEDRWWALAAAFMRDRLEFYLFSLSFFWHLKLRSPLLRIQSMVIRYGINWVDW